MIIRRNNAIIIVTHDNDNAKGNPKIGFQQYRKKKQRNRNHNNKTILLLLFDKNPGLLRPFFSSFVYQPSSEGFCIWDYLCESIKSG